MFTIIICFVRMDFSAQFRIEGTTDMRWEVHFKKNISTIVCLSRICQGDVGDVSIVSLYFKMKSTITCLHHACCLIIDIIVCKYQKEYLQIIDNKHSFVKIEVIAFW